MIHKNESWTHEEIGQVLKVAELLNRKSPGQKFNVSAFCEEIGLSRKNAYKHKRHYEEEITRLRQQLAQLQEQHSADVEKTRLLEARLAEAERNEKLQAVMRELIQDSQKKKSRDSAKSL